MHTIHLHVKACLLKKMLASAQWNTDCLLNKFMVIHNMPDC